MSAVALSSSIAQANFAVTNHSSETVWVSVLTTEIFKDGHVNQFETVKLLPGQGHDFRTNDVVAGRTVSLWIYSESAGQGYFDGMAIGNYEHWGTHFSRVFWTPRLSTSKKKMGNHYVAQQAAEGNYAPLVNLHVGASKVKALQVVPNGGGKKGVWIWYNGFTKALSFKSK